MINILQGEIVFGRYRVKELLGRGAFGEVYLVEHIFLKTDRALKCINRCRDDGDTAHREADILKNLRHPMIPIIYDIEEDDESVCIIEEYIKGESINSLITAGHRFSVKEIVSIARELCDIVNYLHENGIFHQDIKTDNIIYTNGSIKLIDYGNATYGGTTQRVRMGTRWYAAPEAYERGCADSRQDIYAIGMVMLMMSARRPDIAGLKGFPQAFKRIVTRCLAHKGERRFQKVSDLDAELLRATTNKSLSESIAQRIVFVGAHSHCGTTYSAFIAANIYSIKGLRVLLCERNESNDMMGIIMEQGKIELECGIYKVKRIHILPYDYGCVAWDYENDYDVIIYDCGRYDLRGFEGIEYSKICLVTGVREYELRTLGESYSCLEGNSIETWVNYADATTYANAVQSHNIVNPRRVPYMPSIDKRKLLRQEQLL